MKRSSWLTVAQSASVAIAIAGLAAVGAAPARAETQITIYTGMNENFSSRVESTGTPTQTIDWDGKSFQMPPYWGARGTYWFGSGPGWGVALDYTHAKAYGKLDGTSYDVLEFTDGLNLLTLNAMYRFGGWMDGRVVPYVGIGAGASIPHVEVQKTGDPNLTFEYQLAGWSAQVLGGLEYRLDKNWSIFAEGKLSYATIDADLKGGGSLQTEIWQPQLAVGVSYRF